VEYRDYIQVDGVGSGNQSEWMKFSDKKRYGKLLGTLGYGVDSNIEHVLNIIKGRQQTISDKAFKHRASDMLSETKPSIFKRSKQRVWRQERDELAEDLKAHMQQLMARNGDYQQITQVNMIGWSRGGVSCFEMANALANDPETRDIKVNIFALDPVPGGVNNFKNIHRLQSNVATFIAIYAADERSVAFNALLPKLSPNTRVYTTSMPGSHATLVGNESCPRYKKVNLTRAGQLTRDWAEKVLSDWQCEFDNKLHLTAKQQRIMYFQINKFRLPAYRSLQSKVYTLKNRFIDSVEDRVENASSADFLERSADNRQLVNKHHRDILAGNLFAIHGNCAAMPSQSSG